MSDENDGLAPWETALRMWASGQPGPHAWFLVSTVKCLIDRGLLRPEDWVPQDRAEPAECLSEDQRDNRVGESCPRLYGWRPSKYEVAQLRHVAGRLDAAEAEIKELRKRDAEITDRVVAAFCAAWAEAKQ